MTLQYYNQPHIKVEDQIKLLITFNCSHKSPDSSYLLITAHNSLFINYCCFNAIRTPYLNVIRTVLCPIFRTSVSTKKNHNTLIHSILQSRTDSDRCFSTFIFYSHALMYSPKRPRHHGGSWHLCGGGIASMFIFGSSTVVRPASCLMGSPSNEFVYRGYLLPV